MSDFNSSDCYPINLKTIYQLSGSKLYLNICPTTKGFATNVVKLFQLMKTCPRSCTTFEFRGIAKKYLEWTSVGELILWIYVSEEMNVQEEYFIYSFVDLIGIIGGNLGLFVGFSFYDVFNILMDFFNSL